MALSTDQLLGDPSPPSPAQSEEHKTPEVKAVEPTGDARKLKDIHEDKVVHEETFTLKEKTEDVFTSQVQEHFSTFKDTPNANLEPWQAKFRNLMKQRIEVAAGNKSISTIPQEELSRLIQQEARAFALDNKNVELINKLNEFDLKAIQTALGVQITTLDRLAPNIHSTLPGELSDGDRNVQYKGATPISTIAGRVARRILGNKAITLPERINELIDQFPATGGRPRFIAHLTPTEQALYVAEVQKRQVAKAMNKSSYYTVSFPPPAGRMVNFAGLSDAQRLRLQSLGLHDGDNYGTRNNPLNSSETLTALLDRRIKALTESRVDFYTKTGFDIARMKFDFSNAAQIQDPHTKLELEVMRNLPAGSSAETVRIAMSNAIAAETARKTDRELVESAQRKRDERLVEVVNKTIEDLSNPRDQAEIEAKKKELEEEKKATQKLKEKAEAREKLETDIETAKEKIKEVEDGGTETQADYDAYDNWPTERAALQSKITSLETENALFESTATSLSQLRLELADLNKLLAQVRQPNQPKGGGNQNTQQVPAQALNELIRQIQAKEKAIATKESSFKNTAGAVVDIDQRRGEIAAMLVAARAQLQAQSEGPVGWDEEKINRVKSRKKAIEDIARLENRIKAGGFPKESSEEIQRKIEELDTKINNAGEPDQFAQDKKDAWVAVRDHVLSSESRARYTEQVTLLQAGELRFPTSAFYENWPKAHLRTIQVLFGNEAIESPILLAQVTRILPPERYMELYNEQFPGAINSPAELMAFDPINVSKQDAQYIRNAIIDDVRSQKLGEVSQDEQNLLQLVEAVRTTQKTKGPNTAQVQAAERYYFYYRDKADLKLRILRKMALDAGQPENTYITTNTPADIDRIRDVILLADEIVKLRNQRLEKSYGTAAAPTTPVQSPTP